ncbi:MAG: ADP-ribosylglycohydrolase family protein [Opitutales bacterium]|nr:ADP-ribosylglycohydrolase family protein [Opitutales bacterium]
MTDKEAMISRAKGCLLGQLAGDALGSLVEFRSPEDIAAEFPDGVREMTGGGSFNTIPGQPTDDSEMALALARYLAKEKNYHAYEVLAIYQEWLNSHPFDCGQTIRGALTGELNPSSQANGAMMRVAPIGILAARFDPFQGIQWAFEDAALTHPHPICGQANALYVRAITEAVSTGTAGSPLYQKIMAWAEDMAVDGALLAIMEKAPREAPICHGKHQGWVLIAWQNALYELCQEKTFEESLVKTVGRGGDTDTNAAITGALLGACLGGDAIPERWRNILANCRPASEKSNCLNPRPKAYWPYDAENLAQSLVDF